MMNEVLEKIGALRLVPVVKIENSNDAVQLGQALLEARLPLAEITFRTAAAEGAIRTLTAELPELLVGAGTVLSVDQVKSAVAAGARFMVAPGFNLQNLMTYLSFPRVIACGGSWMVEADLISAGNFMEIKRRSREAVAAIMEKFGST